MIGIPFRFRRWNDQDEPVDETVYLRTRRVGPEGERMRGLLREYRLSMLGLAKGAAAAMRIARAAESTAATEALEIAERESAAALTSAEDAKEKSLAVAAQIAAMALEPNYGPGAEKIVDGLTDRELGALVQTLEAGQMPADFFPFPDTRLTPNATGRSGESPAAGS